MTESRSSSSGMMLAIGVAAPAVLATMAVLAFTALEIAGRTPSALGPPRNIAEAAGMGAASEVLRLLDYGEDPNRVLPVRREIISSAITKVTALEAAIWSHHREMIELLDRRGAIVDSATRRYLICLTRDIGDDDILAYLSKGESSVDCVHSAALAAVEKRSKDKDD
ncbi:MAG TPA: hypothetical protein VH436_03205 [Vicinamibacterales bacterium]